MSADSQKQRPPTSTVRCAPNVIPPQAVSDRSIIDSVAGFINDVALTNTPQTDPKDHILWIKFENCADISDPCIGDDWDLDGNLPPPLLLILGYGNGIQIWAVPANGEAIEVLSWRHGVVKTLRILPTPLHNNNGDLATEVIDQFIHKRPLMAICSDSQMNNPMSHHHQQSSQSSANQQFNAINFVSLKDGDQVKSIKFKNAILDVLANRTSILIAFPERIAVFDARTLEDRLTVTTCYPSPGLNPNPVALSDRWIAYAEKRLIPSKRSSGGCDFDGVSSYTATVLNAAKSLSKGLRELGEQVAAGLTGSSGSSGSGGLNAGINSNISGDGSQSGVVTVLDIKHPIRDVSPTTGTPVAVTGNDPIVAHFLAHTEAIVALQFDPSGMLLLTADKRGHDFNIFRIQPHPCGATLASVHHLYVLHRGDTTAKVQDISFSFDSRWVAISTLRGTTHVFPITPYGGPVSVRTHASPHVVNRLSRFHRSAGLSVDGRCGSPILLSMDSISSNHVNSAYPNPRLPPFPHPTVVLPLAQLRQPSSLGNNLNNPPNSKSAMGRQRHTSMSEDSLSKPLRVAVVFAKARSWLLDPPGTVRETPVHRMQRKPIDSLFIMAGHGALIQYDLDPRHASNIAKEKISDDTPIELIVEAKAQWCLQRCQNPTASTPDIVPPLPADNWLIKDRLIDNSLNSDLYSHSEKNDGSDERWMSQVEIITHAGPHRRLWMGPQFMFKTYNTPSGNSLTSIDIDSVEICTINRPARSTPMNMPGPDTGRPLVPVLIESGSCSSHEQSPRLLESFRYESTDSDIMMGPIESQLREDLADAMRESPLVPINRESGPTATASNVNESNTKGQSSKTVIVSIAKVVNPLGTVTTITTPINDREQDEINKLKATCQSDQYIHENWDESLFRPVVTVLGNMKGLDAGKGIQEAKDVARPANMPTQLVVPVIDESQFRKKPKVNEVKLQEKPKVQIDEPKPAPAPAALPTEDSSKIDRKNKKVNGNGKNGKKEKFYLAPEILPDPVQTTPKQIAPLSLKEELKEAEKKIEMQKKQQEVQPKVKVPAKPEKAEIVEAKPLKEEVKIAVIEKPLKPKKEESQSSESQIVKKAEEITEIPKKTEQPSKSTKILDQKPVKSKKNEDVVIKQDTKVEEKIENSVKIEKSDEVVVTQEIPVKAQVNENAEENKIVEIISEASEEIQTIVENVVQKSETTAIKTESESIEKVVELPREADPIKEQPKVEVEPPKKEFKEVEAVKPKAKDYKKNKNGNKYNKQDWKNDKKEEKVVKIDKVQKVENVEATKKIENLDKKEKEEIIVSEIKMQPSVVIPEIVKPISAVALIEEPIIEKIELPAPLEKIEAVRPAKIEDLKPIIVNADDHKINDENTIMKISKHEAIGDDDIEIIPIKNSGEISPTLPPQPTPVKSLKKPISSKGPPAKSNKKGKKYKEVTKTEEFYDMKMEFDDLPPLEPLPPLDSLPMLEPFEELSLKDENQPEKKILVKQGSEYLINLESPENAGANESEDSKVKTENPDDPDAEEKLKLKQKISEIYKDTNFVFAMCSSLKEMKFDEDSKSLASSMIQTSTSSITTNTTTTTFATDSVSSAQMEPQEGQDSDYRSLELEIDDNFVSASEPSQTIEEIKEIEEKSIPLIGKQEGDTSSLDATSSDDAEDTSSSKKSTKINREDDEELRPLITSISSATSLSPLSSSQSQSTSSKITTLANLSAQALPEENQKTQQQPQPLTSLRATPVNGSSNATNNNNKKKFKKKKR